MSANSCDKRVNREKSCVIHDGHQRRDEGRDACDHGRCRLELLSCASPHFVRGPPSIKTPKYGLDQKAVIRCCAERVVWETRLQVEWMTTPPTPPGRELQTSWVRDGQGFVPLTEQTVQYQPGPRPTHHKFPPGLSHLKTHGSEYQWGL